jgi:hypothetical protein
MAGMLSDSWRLTRASFRLISEDRALLVFPVVAGLSIVGVVGLLIAGEYWLVSPNVVGGGSPSSPAGLLAITLFVAAYVAMAFISVYCTAALVGAATLKLDGRQPTAADGWKVARARIGRLTIWALVTATVGLVLLGFERRVGGVAGAAVGVVGGLAWSILTYFMIPVLLYEDQPPIPALKRSGHLFVTTFGRTLASNLVLGLLLAVGIIGAGILVIFGLLSVFAGNLAAGFGLIGFAIGFVVIIAVIGSAAEGILRAALYRYARTGKIDPDLMPSGYATPGGF